MICSANHSPEVMWYSADPRRRGFLNTCPRCRREVLQQHTPGVFGMRDWLHGQCYMCSNMDMSESQDISVFGRDDYIPGRCKCKHHRILEVEMPTEPCPDFVFRHGKNCVITLARAKLTTIHTAYDGPTQEQPVANLIALCSKHGINPRRILVYVYCAGDNDYDSAVYRARQIKSWGATPFLMIDPNGHITPRVKDLRRWGTRPTLTWGMDIADYRGATA